jgi:hypothetical protein
VVIALKTDDVEIYIDGKLLEIGPVGSGHHKVVHAVNAEINVDCDDEPDCEELVWLGSDESEDPAQLHDGEKVYIIKKEVIVN